MVEAAHIDMAHHENQAKRALECTLELDDTVSDILDRVNTEETLIIVTADHSHTLSLSGYHQRTADILGFAHTPQASDGKPFKILNYANGPGFHGRVDMTKKFSPQELQSPKFAFPSMIPMSKIQKSDLF